jgi:uncharacterized protein Yka (UPF0111/DUF47 family)
MFDEQAGLIAEGADKFLELVTVYDRLPERTRAMKQLEGACDAVVEKIIVALDTSFITPFDREDIHTLATSQDDVMDNLERTAHRFLAFRIERPTPEAVSLAGIIRQSCGLLAEAIQLCRTMKDGAGIQARVRAVGDLENEADRIYRESDTALFANEPDLRLLIKWRELYNLLEETVDTCKRVGMILSEIVIKGS